MRHALSVLETAKRALTENRGRLSEGAKQALLAICRLDRDKFPPELRPELDRIFERLGYEAQWTDESEKLEGVWVNLHRMRSGDCIKVTYEVLALEGNVRRHADTLP